MCLCSEILLNQVKLTFFTWSGASRMNEVSCMNAFFVAVLLSWKKFQRRPKRSKTLFQPLSCFNFVLSGLFSGQRRRFWASLGVSWAQFTTLTMKWKIKYQNYVWRSTPASTQWLKGIFLLFCRDVSAKGFSFCFWTDSKLFCDYNEGCLFVKVLQRVETPLLHNTYVIPRADQLVSHDVGRKKEATCHRQRQIQGIL